MINTCLPAVVSHRNRYIEFLAALYQAKDEARKPILLESVDQRLLEMVTTHHFLKQPLSVMQLLTSRDLIFLGASTVSRKLDVLSTAGWIRTEIDVADRRVKYVLPTQQTLDYFDQVNALFPE